MLARSGVKVAENGRDGAKVGAAVEAIRAEGGEAVGAPLFLASESSSCITGVTLDVSEGGEMG